jgi:FdhE protein
MTNPISDSAVEIEKTADALKRLRPAYIDLLDFYKEIFMAQENAQPGIQLDPIPIPEHVLSIKVNEGFPLVTRPAFVIDQAASKDLLTALCRIASHANEKLASSAERLLQAMDEGRIETEKLFKAFMEDETGYLERAAEALKIEKQTLIFFVYNSIKPSLVMNAQKLSTLLSSIDKRTDGLCPVCGSMPGLATLEGEGERFLHCSFCWHKWRIQRLFCTFCGNEAHRSLGYLYSQEEPEYRIDTCDNCKGYIKAVDVRKLERALYPPLEQICTLHLDIKAEEAGFKSPMSQAGKI